jgi:hypothetical protein
MAHRCTNGRTDPALWERAKRDAVKRLGGRHSARAMQLAGKLYRERGGGYCGARTKAQRKLSKWTREDWRTYTGEKACRGAKCDRYLPAAAWERLSPQEAAATRSRKLKARRQYVPNAPAARAAGRRARGVGALPSMDWRSVAVSALAGMALIAFARR